MLVQRYWTRGSRAGLSCHQDRQKRVEREPKRKPDHPHNAFLFRYNRAKIRAVQAIKCQPVNEHGIFEMRQKHYPDTDEGGA